MKKLVLVVEDEFAIRSTLQEALELEGYAVEAAANGKEALEKLLSMPKPDLVLLDLMMPIMSGREFLDAMTAKAELKSVPVIVVSAIATPDSTAGAVCFLRKPVDLDKLLDMVSKYSESMGLKVPSV